MILLCCLDAVDVSRIECAAVCYVQKMHYHCAHLPHHCDCWYCYYCYCVDCIYHCLWRYYLAHASVSVHVLQAQSHCVCV